METTAIYKKKYHIEISDTDFTNSLKLSSLFNYFQDIASEAAGNLGAGIDTLIEKYGVTWILVRIRVEIKRKAAWNEDILIETWHHEPKRLEFERDYIVRDESGNIIASAVSSWVIVDINTREIRRADLLSFNSSTYKSERAIDCKLGKFKPLGQLQTTYGKVIGYSDIDFNGHINNSRYIDYAMDCLSMEEHLKYDVRSLEISYLNEALPGDVLMLKRDISQMDSNLLYIEGFSEKNEKVVFKSQFEIKGKDIIGGTK